MVVNKPAQAYQLSSNTVKPLRGKHAVASRTIWTANSILL